MQNQRQIKLLNHCFHKSSKKKKSLIDFEISDMKVSEQFDCSCKSILDIKYFFWWEKAWSSYELW